MYQKVILLFVIILMALIILSCNQSGGSSTEQEEKIPVEITYVELGNVEQSLAYNGDIKAEYEVKVYSKIPDRIEKFYVEEGEVVKKGAPIAQIVATTIEQAVRQAEAALVATRVQEANLRVEFERAQRLSKEDAMSKQQYETVKMQFESVQAQVKQTEAVLAGAKSQLNEALINAPIFGIIGKKYYETGDMANPALPLVSIVQMERVDIEFNATEEDLGILSIGQKAKVNVKAYPDRQFTGTIDKISPILDPVTRMAEIEVLVNNPDKLLKPGMYAKVEVTTGVIEDVVVVPRYSAIETTIMEEIDGKDQVVRNYFVFVVDSNRAEQRKLDVKYVNHRWIATNSGIKVGEKLVTAGQHNLRDNVAVSIVKEEGKSL